MLIFSESASSKNDFCILAWSIVSIAWSRNLLTAKPLQMSEFPTSTVILKLAAFKKLHGYMFISYQESQNAALSHACMYDSNSWLPRSFNVIDFWNVAPEALSWQIYSPNGFALTLLVSIWSSPLVEVATVCPFLMNESVEKGGNWMLALQVRVAPLFLVAACLSESRLNVKSKIQRTMIIDYIDPAWL